MEISSRYAIYQELTALEVNCISITNVQEKRSDLQLPEAGGKREGELGESRHQMAQTSRYNVSKYKERNVEMIHIINAAMYES